MIDDLFAREYLLHGADLAADDHVQIAVVDGCTDRRASLIVIGDEGEVETGVSGDEGRGTPDNRWRRRFEGLVQRADGDL